MGYTVDGQIQVVQRSQTSGGDSLQMATSRYSYYNDGMLEALYEIQPDGGAIRTDSYSYDTAGQTVSEYSESPDSDPANIDNKYVYDASGQVSQVTNNITGAITNCTFGADGNPTPPTGTVLGATTRSRTMPAATTPTTPTAISRSNGRMRRRWPHHRIPP